MSIDLDREYTDWNEQGCPKDQNGSVPHAVKMYYVLRTLRVLDPAESRKLVFVESGTSHGDGTYAILPHVDEVHTIEAYEPCYDFAADRFNGESAVNIYFGDSGKVLPDLLPELENCSVVFWLDAHYSGDGTAMLDKETPIVAELEAISNVSNLNHAIVIDDARGFGEWNDYPSIDWMKRYCEEAFPHHKFFLEGDEIFLVPEW